MFISSGITTRIKYTHNHQKLCRNVITICACYPFLYQLFFPSLSSTVPLAPTVSLFPFLSLSISFTPHCLLSYFCLCTYQSALGACISILHLICYATRSMCVRAFVRACVRTFIQNKMSKLSIEEKKKTKQNKNWTIYTYKERKLNIAVIIEWVVGGYRTAFSTTGSIASQIAENSSLSAYACV